MKVLLVQEIEQENLAIMQLAAVLEEKCELFIHTGGSLQKLLNLAKRVNPELVMFTSFTAGWEWVSKAVLSLTKNTSLRKKPLIAVGGVHPTFSPEVISFPGIDIVARGEGEETAVELIEKIRRNETYTNVRNLWVKLDGKIYRNPLRPLINNLDGLPWPRRDIYNSIPFIRDYPLKMFMASRGCPYRCTFCFNHAYKKLYSESPAYVRRRSVENVIGELIDARSRFRSMQAVWFWDDIFILDRRWVLDFLKLYRKEVSLPFVCYVRADLVDKEIASALKKSGAGLVHMGLETGNEVYRNDILKKKLYDRQIENATRILHDAGLHVRTTQMTALPGETVEMFLETVRLNRKISSDSQWIGVFQPFPGFELTSYARKTGNLESKWYEISSWSSGTCNFLNQPDNDMLIRLHKLFRIMCAGLISEKTAVSLVSLLRDGKTKKLLDIFLEAIYVLSFGFNHIQQFKLLGIRRDIRGYLENARRLIKLITKY